jgi:DNA polymerase III delta subunit
VLFQQYAVWEKQQKGFTQAVKRLKTEDIPVLFRLAYQADRHIKGASSGDSWDSLQKTILYLLGYRIA